jgi:hypothetical protein
VIIPDPLAADGQVSHDPVSQSVLVKVKAGSHAGLLWRQGHRALFEAEEAGRYASNVWAHAPGRRELARGEPVRDGWLRFKLSDDDYRRLAGTPDLSAIVTVDRKAGQILGVRFLGGRSG